MPKRVKKPQRKGKSKPLPLREPGHLSGRPQDPGLRIAAALERLAPATLATPDFAAADAFVWHPPGRLAPITRVNRVEMSLLKGIDRVRDLLLENTERFARGLPANNALLWGARGMGKSSLVKAVHATVNAAARRTEPAPSRLKLIEIHREDIESLPDLMALTRGTPHRCIVFCDDLSFDAEDTSYKSLKAVLEGGIEGRPDNVVFYATSNRRHLMPRDMMENERATAINPGEARLSPLQPGRILGDGGGLCGPLRHCVRRRAAHPRGAGMGDHARRPLGPGRLAIRAGSGGTARGTDRGPGLREPSGASVSLRLR
jgi:predicted AAA+ superfamily ATPase